MHMTRRLSVGRCLLVVRHAFEASTDSIIRSDTWTKCGSDVKLALDYDAGLVSRVALVDGTIIAHWIAFRVSARDVDARLD